jgi:sulfate adenylyltransferase
VGLSGFAVEAFRFVAEGAAAPGTYAHEGGLAVPAYGVYFVHLVLVFGLLVYLPYSKFAHMWYRTVAMIYAEHTGRTREGNSAGAGVGKRSIQRGRPPFRKPRPRNRADGHRLERGRTMSQLVKPHGKEQVLKPLLLEGEELAEAKKKAETLKKIPMTSRETGDAIMMGIGGFTPLEGFMGHDDWKGTVVDMAMTDGTFWPIPVTLSASKEQADAIGSGEEVTLVDEETGEAMAIMTVAEKYAIDKVLECKEVFKTDDLEHPGVAVVMAQKEVNLAGPIKVLSELNFPTEFAGIYQRPADARAIFEERGWNTVAALQLRNPMHQSHAYLAKVAIEVTDGVYIHQLLGALKPGDIPADTRVKCIDALVQNYFRPERVVQGGYPLDMRYAGPREALLHALFRQNYGCSHLIVGRDHAGVGDYYGPFDAHKIFDEIPWGLTPDPGPEDGLDLLLLSVRGDGLHEDLPPLREGGPGRERQLCVRGTAPPLRHRAAEDAFGGEARSRRVQQAGGGGPAQGVLRGAGGKGGGEAPRRRHRGRRQQVAFPRLRLPLGRETGGH